MDGRIRLDLGAGHWREKGWISVDFVDATSKHRPDLGAPEVMADLRQLPFPDHYADEARAIHVIEHLWPWEALETVQEWVRVLKPGGKLAIECPCFEKVLKLAEVPQIEPNYVYWALYGDPRHKRPEMMHRWAYSTLSLTRLMAQAGLEELRPERPQFHFPIRDMRVIGFKPQTMLVIPGRQ